jgi:hypothetical protein
VRRYTDNLIAVIEEGVRWWLKRARREERAKERAEAKDRQAA